MSIHTHTFRLNYSRAAIYADSYSGVFPPGSIERVIKTFGMCNWLEYNGVTSTSVVEQCRNGTMDIQTVVNSYIHATSMFDIPVPWGYLQSKGDLVQQSFYDLIGIHICVCDPHSVSCRMIRLVLILSACDMGFLLFGNSRLYILTL